MRKAVITLVASAVLLLAGSASFSSATKPGLCIPPIGKVTVPGLTCTTTSGPPTTPPTTKPPSTTTGGSSSTGGTPAPTTTKPGTPPAVLPVITPSASQLASTSGRAGLPTTGGLTDPAASPLLAVPQDALAAPQLASADAPASNTQMVAVGPTGGNVLAAGQSSLLTPSSHPLLRVMLALAAIAIAALAASQLPAARRLTRAGN